MSLSFGTPSSAPATGGLTGGFNFGANKSATPGFGLAATSQPSTGLFGNTPANTMPAFGTASTQALGGTTTPAFGATTPAFGATTTPAFGATTTPAFGATSTPAFGATTTPAFGATTTSAFGATTTPAFGATTTPAFGATTTPAFGASTTPAFGSTSLGTGGLNFAAGSTTSAPNTGLNFGTPAATTTSAGLGGLGGFGFGTSTAATQNAGFGLFGSTSTATTSTGAFGAKLGTTSLNVIGTQPSTSVTPSLGLGGMGAPTASGGAATNTTASADSKSEPPKQNKLPNEILVTVDSYKEFVKKQKSISSELMRVSNKPLYKVAREAKAMLRSALSLSSELSRARAHSKRLRAAATSAQAAADIAARDTPGYVLEGSAPPSYVWELISELEQQLITFRRQMDVADKQMQASHKLLSEQELNLGIRRIYESFVVLAGRLQAVHTQVEAQKEQYLNLRKYILNDPTDVFDGLSPSTSLDQILGDAEGTRKKAKTYLSEKDYIRSLGNLQHLAGPTPFTYMGSTTSPFPTADTSGTSWQPQPQTQPIANSLNVSSFAATATADTNSNFQLQKPPGKRGKQ